MKQILQFNRFMVMLVAMLTLSLTNVSAAGTDPVYTGTFKSKSWAVNETGTTAATWTSDKDAYQYSSPNVQITAAYTGAGATSTVSYTNIKKISISASTTSKGVGNITVKVGDGTAQTICSLSKSSTAKTYDLEYATPVSGNVTFVVNCSTNSMYVQSISITTAAKTPTEISVKTPPTKVDYVAGEMFDPSGLVITAKYSATESEDIAYSDDTKDEFTFAPDLITALQTTDSKVTITYAEKSVDQTISVSAPSGKTVTVTANPTDAVTSISASPYVDVKSGDEVSLSYEKKDGYNFTSWSSDQVTVTDNKFTMPDPAVDVTITANFDTIFVTEVQLKSATSIEVGASETLVATVLPEDALVKTLTWASSDDKIATVDQSGKVTAVAAGTVNITATSTNGKVGTCAVTVTGGYDVVHDFTQISGFSTWGSSYSERTVNYSDDKVVFASANKQTSTITNMPVTKGQPVSLVLTNAKKYISKVKFECTQWSSNAQTITLNYSKDGGATYSKLSPSVTSSNFTLTSELPDSVNAVKFTFNNTSKQVGISKLSFNMADRQLVSSAVTITAPETTQGTLAVKKGETTISSGSNATELDTLTIVASPQSGYKVQAISVIDADQNEVAVDDDNKFVMPNKAVTVSATFESAKVLTSVEITTPASKTEFWKGEEFTAEGLVLTAHFDGAEDAVVEPDSIVGYNMSVAGQQTVKVYFTEGATTKYAEYTINVKTIANTKETAYSVDSAIKLVVAGKDLATKVYVKGVITSISGQSNNNVFVKDAGLTNSFEFYNLADGSTYKVEDLTISDTIIGYGEMTYYAKSGIYEFKAGCTLEDRKEYIEIPCAIENTLETAYTVAQAIALIDQGECLTSAQVYVKGVVTSISGSTTKDIVICDAGQSNSFKFYQIVDGDATVANVQLYDTISAKGYLMKYQSTYELDANCTLEQIKAFVPHVLSVAISPKATSMTANGEIELEATVLPADAPDKTVTWSVIEGADLVSVEDGVVSGLNAGAGTAKVMVKTTDGGFMDTCVITVNAVDTRKTASITAFTNASDTLSPAAISYIGEKGFATTATAAYSNALRVYQNGGLVTIAAAKGCKIDEVIITTTSDNATTAALTTTRQTTIPTSGKALAKSSTTSMATGLNADSAFVYCLGTAKGERLIIASLVVKYTGEPLTIDTIKVSGEYQTEFDMWEIFNHDNAVVTAYYSDQTTTADVTSASIFSAPNMAQQGVQTVTVTYGDYATNYDITVKAPVLDTIKVSGDYKATFKVGDTFNHDNAVVTAIFNSTHDSIVTPEATFSTPDMSAAGIKIVTVTYQNKQTTYDINVLDSKTAFYESFNTNNGTGGNDGKWNGSIASNELVADNEGWTFTKGNGANKCAKFGTGSDQGSAISPVINAMGDLTITFKAAAWNGTSEVTAIRLSASNGALSDSIFTLTKAEWNTFEVTLTGVTEALQLTFAASQASNNRFFLDEISVTSKYTDARQGLAVGQYGTMCSPIDVPFYTGATFYQVDYIDKSTNELFFNEVEAGDTLKAGKAYLFKAIANKIQVVQMGNIVSTPLSGEVARGFYGLFESFTIDASYTYYGIYGEKIQPIAQGVIVPAGRSYIKLDELKEESYVTPGAPVRRLAFGTPKGAATGLDYLYEINADGAQKMMINGQVIIIRNGQIYNAQGQIVK